MTSTSLRPLALTDGAGNPWIEVNGIEALRVPGHTQPDKENECLLYALWMVLQFISTVYPSSSVRETVDPISPDQMKDAITIRESGWSPDQGDLDSLSEMTDPVSWELKTWLGPPPANTFDQVIQSNLEETLPTIAVVDVARLHQRDHDGPLHAIVVTGMEGKKVVVNDPWGVMYDIYPRDLVVDAWDTTLNRFITVDLSKQTTLQSELNEVEDRE